MSGTTPKFFRDREGHIKPMLSSVEGISYRENPLDFFILLARYKFAARLIKPGDRVLDAGCGHGHGTVFLSKFAKHVTGGDLDDELIRRNAQDYADVPNVAFQKLDLLDISFPKDVYDVVVSIDVIEHFSKEQTERVAKNCHDLTADKGFAVIGTPNVASQPFASRRRLDTHLHEFDPSEFEQLLSKHFARVFLFSMTDEVVSLTFSKLAWYMLALCTK